MKFSLMRHQVGRLHLSQGLQQHDLDHSVAFKPAVQTQEIMFTLENVKSEDI